MGRARITGTLIDFFKTTATGIISVVFPDAGAPPAEVGELLRHGADVKWYDGTAARTVVSTDATQTLTNKTLTATASIAFTDQGADPTSPGTLQRNGGRLKWHDGNVVVTLDVPPGTVVAFAGTTIPAGWLLCNGQAVSRTTYAALFAVIGTTYGAGDGSTTFNVPNLLSRVPVGFDSGAIEFNAMGKTGGAKTHTLTVAELPSHSHTASGNIAIYQTGNEAGGHGTKAPADGFTNRLFVDGGSTGVNVTVGSTGGGGAHNNLQPYITMNYIIRT
jgi:microcystin-dependent protein